MINYALRKIFFVIVLLWGMAGCNPAARFSVVEAPVPVMNGLSSLHGRAVVANGGGRDLVVENASFVVRYRDRELGTARLMLPVEIPAGATTSVRYDLALEGVTLASLQTLQTRIMANPGAFTVDADVWVVWGAFRKKIRMKGVEATRVMGIFVNFIP